MGDKNRHIFNGNPNNDLQGKHSLWMIINLALARQKGQYSSEPFKHWLQEHLEARNTETFESQLPENQSSKPWYQRKELKVVVSDLSRQTMAVLPDNLGRDYQLSKESFSIAEAVRLSMSIPFFFEPGNLGGSVIVDGGILSNFPLWIFDTGEQEAPKCPTFGFQLKDEESHPINGAIEMLVAMLRTMQVARDRHHVETHNQDRVLEINAQAVSTTQFNLTNEDKKVLYAEGYKAAKEFLLTQWSWQEHLRHRGFSIGGGPSSNPIKQVAA